MAANYRILVCETLGAEGLALLNNHPAFSVDIALNLSKAELLAKINPYDALLIRSQTIVDKELINAGANLKFIGRAGVGTNNIDMPYAKERSLVVVNTPSANSISTAEFAFALMLALSRDIPQAHQHVRSGLWSRADFMGQELADKKLGIVGFGNVGRLLAARAQAFSMQVAAFDPQVQDSVMAERGVLKLTLPELLKSSDILSLHCGLNSESEHMINADTIALMKPGLMLINTARGELIDDKALLQALERKHISKAALDVYATEPPGTDNALLNHPRIINTPHLGASTQEAQKRVSTVLAEQTISFFEKSR